MIEGIISFLLEIVNEFGYWGIFIIMFIENIGVPVPTEVGFIAGQAMVTASHSTYLEIFLVILLGKTSGSIVSYLLGRFFADRIRLYKNSSRLKKSQEIFRKWLSKYDSFAVFLSRVIGYIRPWSGYLAGIGQVKFIPFIIYNILGSAVIILLTMLVLGSAVELWKSSPSLRPFAIPLFLVFFLGFWVGLWIHNKIEKKHSGK